MFHAFPSESELCSICGQLVQYTYLEASVNDKEIGLAGRTGLPKISASRGGNSLSVGGEGYDYFDGGYVEV